MLFEKSNMIWHDPGPINRSEEKNKVKILVSLIGNEKHFNSDSDWFLGLVCVPRMFIK